MKVVRSTSRRLNLVRGFSAGMLILAAGCSNLFTPPPDEDNTSNIPIVGVGTLLVSSESNISGYTVLRTGGIAWSADGEEVFYGTDTYGIHRMSVPCENHIRSMVLPGMT